MKQLTYGFALALLAASMSSSVIAQTPAPGRPAAGGTIGTGPGYPTAEEYANSKAAQALVAKAKGIAGNDAKLQMRVENTCSFLGPQRPALEAQNAGKKPDPPVHIEPVKLFDNLFYFGYNTIGAWAIPTSDGIILIDALNNQKDAEEIIEPDMKKLGLDPSKIKLIIVGHGHFDHFGGAPYLQQKYGAKVAMSKVDWDIINRPNPNATAAQAARPLPKREIEIVDGQKITQGDETITLYSMPGHTPGSLGYIIPLKNHGQPITALMLSGANITPNRETMEVFQKTLDKARAFQPQVLMNGHPGLFGDEMSWMNAVRSNPNGPNEFLYTKDQFSKFIDIMKTCAESRIVAMEGK
jgi:metallo-beta-lactamase class B